MQPSRKDHDEENEMCDIVYVCVCVCVCVCTSEGVRYPVSPDAEGQRECESWGEYARAGGRGGCVALGVRG